MIHKFFFIWFVASVTLLLAQEELVTENQKNLEKQVTDMVSPYIEHNWNKGIAVGVYQKGQENQMYFYGIAKDDTPVNENTIFEIGSITKTFTAILLADKINKEELRLEDTVDTFFAYPLEYDEQKVNLEHLVTHTSAIPTLPDNFAPQDPDNPYADYTEEQLNDFLENYTLYRKPGEQYEYSNLGMSLLGRIICKKENDNYENLVTNVICKPLAMSKTSIKIAEENTHLFANGHTADGDVISHWDLPVFESAGALRSDTIDMLKYIEANVVAQNAAEKNALQKAMVMAQQKRKDIAPNYGIAMGWHLIKDEILCHDGGTGGFCTFIAFDPKNEIGVTILSNSAISISSIGINIMKILRGEEPKIAPVRKSVDIDKKIFDNYVGQYQIGFMMIDIFVENDKLMAQASNQPKFRIYPESENKFFYKVVDAQLEFIRNDQGKVDKLILYQLGRELPALKIK